MAIGKSAKEKASELRARALLEQELERQLTRAPERAIPTVDYRIPERDVGIEVKRVTNAEYHDLTSAFAKARHLDSDRLTGRWAVLVDRPTLSTSLEPMPDFRDDDPELIAYWESQGFTVRRRADLEADWRATHPGPPRKTPRLDTLARDLEPHLVELEAHGFTTTRGAAPFGQPEPLATAITAIYLRTQDGMCLRQEPLGGERAGIDVHLASGYVRTGRADTIAARLQLWLGSSNSENLRASLANEPDGTERHAVLVFDAQTEPEYDSAVEQGMAFCPTVDLELPEEVSVVWFILGPIACRFSRENGWRTVRMPDAQDGMT